MNFLWHTGHTLNIWHMKMFRISQPTLMFFVLPTGIDQYDRDSIINDFKNGACRLMVATSVAARGLDVKQLILVINYNCPNHYEDYVHRVGRTGRAGNKVSGAEKAPSLAYYNQTFCCFPLRHVSRVLVNFFWIVSRVDL